MSASLPNEDQHLRLFILGGKGRTGRPLIQQALARGHQVTALLRSPEKFGPPLQGMTIRQGDAQALTTLRETLPGHDAVISALGAPGLGPSTNLRKSAESLVAAMQATGPRRLLVVSMGALFPDAGLVAAILRKTFLRNVAEDSAEMERIITHSGLDWTIVRPPRLTNGPLQARYSVKDNGLPKGGKSLPRADLAHFLLAEVERNQHLRCIVGMAST